MSPAENSAADDTVTLPADLRWLKILVITLLVVMILGLLTIVGLFVTRLGASRPLPEMPASVVLPEGAVPAAITFARDWLVVVAEDGRVILFDREGGAPVSVTPLP